MLSGHDVAELVAEPAPGDVQYLEDRIYEFNSSTTGITDGGWLAIFVRDENHRIVAGICGNTWGGCAEIRQFWVDEPRRKQGLGTRLLAAAEAEARRRGAGDLITVVHADLLSWQPPSGKKYALVVCTGYFDRAVFAMAASAVAAGGLLGWEAFTLAARRDRPRLPAEWCLRPGEPANLLPADFDVMSQDDVGAEPATRRRLLARRRSDWPPGYP